MAINLRSIVQSNVDSLKGSFENTARNFGSRLAGAAFDSIGPAGGILKQLLKGPSSIPLQKTQTPARVAGADNDWRVRLSVPSSFQTNTVLKPLVETNNSLVFPYTPTILIQHTANYDSMHPIHSNYPFPSYQNSQIEDIVITGDFFCENAKDAQYWTAMVHYLRSVTKMAYGQSENNGAPPPLVFLNGYGDFVFPNVPVIVKNFTVDLPADVDYIKTNVEGGDITPNVTTPDPSGGYVGWAPVQSQVAVTVSPIYSRAKTSQFSLESFVGGGYLGKNQSGGGFI